MGDGGGRFLGFLYGEKVFVEEDSGVGVVRGFVNRVLSGCSLWVRIFLGV